jgi:hypothetical protein
MQDYSKISTDGTKISAREDGTLDITFDKSKVSEKAFKEILEYIYTDRVGWNKDTDSQLIQDVKSAAQYLQLDRLVAICDSHLDKTKNITIPESLWWKNMKWAFENLRTGKTSVADLTLICKGGDKPVDVMAHACIVCAASKYFFTMLLGDVPTEEAKTKKVVIDDATESQMNSILKYIYSKEFDVDVKDVVGVWILANKFVLEDLQVECESMILKNLNKDNAKDIKKVAELLQSKRIMEQCDEKLKG